MIHERKDTNLNAMRAEFPDAAIIRRLDRGWYMAFDLAGDAIGHPIAVLADSVKNAPRIAA